MKLDKGARSEISQIKSRFRTLLGDYRSGNSNARCAGVSTMFLDRIVCHDSHSTHCGRPDEVHRALIAKLELNKYKSRIMARPERAARAVQGTLSSADESPVCRTP